MIIVERKPVPIYEIECIECHSILHFKKSEVRSCFISCPVCDMSNMVTLFHPVEYEDGEP